MRIAHVVGTLNAGGVQKLVVGLAQAEALRAHEHVVICTGNARGDMRDEVMAACEVLEVPLLWPEQLPIPSYRVQRWIRMQGPRTFAARFAWALRRARVDLVHSHISQRIDLQIAGARLARTPLVWTIHGLYKAAGDTLAQWQRSARAPHVAITADSSPVADDFVARGAGPRDRVEVVHAGADVRAFLAPRERAAGWRARYGIPDDAVVFGTSGRLTHEKAHDVLVAAAAQLPANAHVVIAGSGALEAPLAAQIAALRLGDRVHLLGFTTDVPGFLRELDVFVLPSRSEGFPLALIEALAASRPCIASRIGGVPEMLGADGGIIVPPDDATALAAAMRSLLEPAARAELATRGPALAQRFSFDQCAADFARVYGQLK